MWMRALTLPLLAPGQIKHRARKLPTVAKLFLSDASTFFHPLHSAPFLSAADEETKTTGYSSLKEFGRCSSSRETLHEYLVVVLSKFPTVTSLERPMNGVSISCVPLDGISSNEEVL